MPVSTGIEPPYAHALCPEPHERPDLWPWTAWRRDDGLLEIQGQALADITSGHSLPLTLLDNQDLEGRASVWVSALAEEFWDGYGLAGASAFCSVDHLPSAEAARIVVRSGMGVSVASMQDINTAVQAGAAPSVLDVDANVLSSDILHAALMAHTDGDVPRVVIGTITEAAQVNSLAAQYDLIVPVFIRVSISGSPRVSENSSDLPRKQQSTVSWRSPQSDALITHIAASDNLEFRGFSGEVDSLGENESAWIETGRQLMHIRSDCVHRYGSCAAELRCIQRGREASWQELEPLSALPLSRKLADMVREESKTTGFSVPHLSLHIGRSVVFPSTITVCQATARDDIFRGIRVTLANRFPNKHWASEDLIVIPSGSIAGLCQTPLLTIPHSAN